MTFKTLRKILLWPLFVIGLTTISMTLLAATEDLIESDFEGHLFRLLPGESSQQETSIKVRNTSNENYSIHIQFIAPQGITLTHPQQVNVPPNQSLDVPLTLTIREDQSPGTFNVQLEVRVFEGSSQIEVYEFIATVTVLNSDHNVRLNLTHLGTVLDVPIRVFEQSGDTLSFVSQGLNGRFSDELTPGDYVALANDQGFEILRYPFTVTDQVIERDLEVQAVFLESLQPQWLIDDLVTLRLNYRLAMLYETTATYVVETTLFKQNIPLRTFSSETLLLSSIGVITDLSDHVFDEPLDPGEYQLESYLYRVSEDSSEQLGQAITRTLTLQADADDQTPEDDNDGFELGVGFVIALTTLVLLTGALVLRKKML